MMKSKFFYLTTIVCCFMGHHFLNAESFPDVIFTEKTAASIDDPEQYTAQIEALASIEHKNEENTAYVHRIKEIDIENRQVILEDHSKWDIGWWYKNILNDWQPGDRLMMAYTTSINGMGMHNLDRNTQAWGSVWTFNLPTPEYSDSIVEIIHLEEGDFCAIITLKSGFQFGIPYNISGIRFIKFLQWRTKVETLKVGNPVFVFHGTNSCVILNLGYIPVQPILGIPLNSTDRA